MEENLLRFIDDMFSFVGEGRWNQFKQYLISRGYTEEVITEMEEKLTQYLEDNF